MPNIEETDCINRLQEIEQMFENILKLINPIVTLDRESRLKAQELLKVLKNHLKEEVHFYTSEKNKDKITLIDKNFYLPAILDAKSHLRIKVNSVPNQKWFADIYSAEGDISHWRYKLTHKDYKM